MFRIPTRTTGCIPIDHSHDNGGAQSHRRPWRIFQISNNHTVGLEEWKERGSSILNLPTVELHRTSYRIIVRTTEQVVKRGVYIYKGLMNEQRSLSADGAV